MKTPLNLASRPFRNESLPALLFGIACVGLLAFTAYHAVLAYGLSPGRSSALHGELAALQAETARLRQESQKMRVPKPDRATLAQWTLLKELVDRRTFSWTHVLGRLEAVVPEGVRIIAVEPSLGRGEFRVELTTELRSPEDGLLLVRALEACDEFEDVYPVSDEGAQGGDARFRMRYQPPERVPGASPAPTPAASPEPAPAEGKPS
jgi:hypothetical protein